MKTKVLFRLNEQVTLFDDSVYYAEQCKGMSGTIIRLPLSPLLEGKEWYEIRWSNGTQNVYEPHDIYSLEPDWDK